MSAKLKNSVLPTEKLFKEDTEIIKSSGFIDIKR